MQLEAFLQRTGLAESEICDDIKGLVQNGKIIDATFIDFDRSTAVLLTVDYPVSGEGRTGVPQIGTYKIFKQPKCLRCGKTNVWITADNPDYWSFPGLVSLSHAKTLAAQMERLARRGDELIYGGRS